MKAIIADKPGGPEVLHIAEVPKPEAKEGQVLIAVKATALNGADIMQRQGGYPPPKGASDILGLEVAGEVAAVGKGVQRWKVGDKVAALLDGGGYAEFVATAEGLVFPIPEGLSFEQAAAIPEVWLTAYLELVWLAGLKKGDTLLIHAGASGVGTAAIQLAKAIGAYIFVTAGSQEKLDLCKELGADVLINYKEENFVDVLKNKANHKAVATGVPGGRTQEWGADVILDLVGASHFPGNIEALALEGRLLIVGLGGGRTAEVDLGKVLMKRLKVIGSTLRARTLEQKVKLVQEFSAFALDKFSGEKPIFRPVVDRTLSLADAKEAHEYLGAKKNKGKIILKV